MIEIKNLKKTFGDQLIFRDINLKIEKGDCVVIIGESGCGKSTLLRCINKLETPDSGKILFKGENVLDKKTNIDKVRKHIGMVFQNFNLFSNLNVLENVIIAPCKVNKMKKSEAINKVKPLIKQVGMENRMFYMPSQLSGGQKQRVAIARCLAMEPDVILFDEPTSALDPTMVEEVEKVIASLIDQKMTSVIVTHDMRFAKNIATKVIFLAEKGIYEEGNAKDIFENPQRELTRRFLFHSRMFEKELTKKNVDTYSLLSEMQAFAINYDVSKHQFQAIDHALDEFVLPLLNNSNVPIKINLRFVCDDSADRHQLLLEVVGIEEDPLKSNAIDNLSISLVKGFVRSLKSGINGDDNWEITINL